MSNVRNKKGNQMSQAALDIECGSLDGSGCWVAWCESQRDAQKLTNILTELYGPDSVALDSNDPHKCIIRYDLLSKGSKE